MLQLLRSAKEVARNVLQSRYWPDRPQQLNFEITAACDARCIHCPRLDMDRPAMPMKWELFCKMIDEAAALGVPYICPNGYGEICTIPMRTLVPHFDYMTDRCPSAKIIINTNGHRMFEDRAELFIKHKVHLVNVTIDGATAATAEAIRVGLKFDQIEANIKKLLALRDAAGAKRPKVRVGMVAMPQTIPEVEPFFARWEGIADYVGIGGFSSRLTSVGPGPERPAPELLQLGQPGKPAPPPQPRASACVLPFKDLNIWADGKAVLCCDDWNEEHVVGDLNSESLKDIWHSPRMEEVRRKHIAKAGHEVALCAKCDNWQQPGWGARLWA
jgi:MoaA/NifB/PqqE/SkfB family radical SAM enzyme